MFRTTKACLTAVFLAAVFLAAGFLVAAFLAGWAGLAWTAPASAAERRPGVEHDAPVGALMDRLAEAPAAAGLSANQALIEVSTEPDGGT